jgi:hypothetical protein
MTRQAISPRFAIRIFLNMLVDRLGLLGGFPRACGTAKTSRGNGISAP